MRPKNVSIDPATQTGYNVYIHDISHPAVVADYIKSVREYQGD